MDASTLQTLIARARSRSEIAQGRHAAAQRRLEQGRAHLQTLRQYALEYESRARSRAGDRRDPSAERNQTVFLDRLGEAVAAQEREVGAREGIVRATGAELALCLRRQKSLQTLLQRQLERARRDQARREQKQTDEFAQRAAEIARAAHCEEPVTRMESEA